jgi:hypothetical protein
MLFMSPQRMGLERIQGAYISDDEIETLVGDARERWGDVDGIEHVLSKAQEQWGDVHLHQEPPSGTTAMQGDLEASADNSVIVVAPRVSEPRVRKQPQVSHTALLDRWPETLRNEISDTLRRREVVALIMKAQAKGVCIPLLQPDGTPLNRSEWEAALHDPIVQTVVITAVQVLKLSRSETCRFVFGTNTHARIIVRIGEIVRQHE